MVSVKRMFQEMATSTKMDLNKLQCELAGAGREVGGACNGVLVNLRQTSKFEEAQQLHIERENLDLKSQLSELRAQLEGAKLEIGQRDQRMQQLLQDIKTLEDRYIQIESQASQTTKLNDELDRLNVALRDIAQAVVQDAESSVSSGICDSDPSSHHLHLSQPSIPPPRSPKRSSRTSQAFAEGTISAVQAALHKYQLAIHDLQVKLESSNESLALTKKQFDSSEHNRELLSMKVNELTEKLDTTNFQLSELYKERDGLQKTLDSIRSDKHTVERGKAELNSIVIT